MENDKAACPAVTVLGLAVLTGARLHRMLWLALNATDRIGASIVPVAPCPRVGPNFLAARARRAEWS
ncbi:MULTISPECIES: hypothetical protein [Streptomyces violaceusniger group]|uniref:Uncharacterized protein n=2 Tax=Streptomyces javensis TaxID=114698 RepID=A0ABN1WLJ4_9ACTN|nr:hypothetical protein [Streptomyces javensis]MBI0316965.1 hypothetical protein [Streptomyces javensis]